MVGLWVNIPRATTICIQSQFLAGIILLDPPFCLQNELGKCQNSAYRTFVPRTDIQEAYPYHSSLINCLRQNKILQKGGVPCPFVVLTDLYRIIASEWVVVNICF